MKRRQLYAAGFNAHGQLNRLETASLSQNRTKAAERNGSPGVGEHGQLIDDVPVFMKIFEGEALLLLDACWSQTFLQLGKLLFTVGHRSQDLADYSTYATIDLSPNDKGEFDTYDEANLRGAVSSHDGLQVFFRNEACIVRILSNGQVCQKSNVYCMDGIRGRITHIACTSAGLTAAVFYPFQRSALCSSPRRAKLSVLTFEFLSSLIDCLIDYPASGADTTEMTDEVISRLAREVHQAHSQVLGMGIMTEPLPDTVFKSLLATATGFVALMAHGEVYTWGDGRYPHALGRPVNADNPAGEPHLVSDLLGLGVNKIVTGGSMAGALTEAGDAYVWGMPPLGGGFEDAKNRDLHDLLRQRQQGEDMTKISLPATLEDEQELEVADIAIGDGHLLVLDTDGQVWICGSNNHGQLGLGDNPRKEEQSVWRKVRHFDELLQKEGKKPVKVHAGDLTSFVMIEDA